MTKERPYNIKIIDSSNYLVKSNDYIRLDEILPQLTVDLKNKKVRGDVLFDLLLSNGNNSSRFIMVFFDGDAFLLSTLKKVTQLTDAFKNFY